MYNGGGLLRRHKAAPNPFGSPIRLREAGVDAAIGPASPSCRSGQNGPCLWADSAKPGSKK